VPEAPARADAFARLYPASRRHLEALTGELGILQHAIGSEPDPAHGYCVDDVARALQVDLLHARVLGWAAVSDSASRSLEFLEAAFDEKSGRFRNFRAMDGSWDAGRGSQDSFGRAMLALGETIAMAPDAAFAERARTVFDLALPAASRLTSPRAQASVVLGCAALLSVAAARAAAIAARGAGGAARGRRPIAPAYTPAAVMRAFATGLHVRFTSFARPGWPWPEDTLTYENALLPRAMIVAGEQMGATTMVRIGRQVLDWLIDVQTAPDGHLSPIGNGWWPRGGLMSKFDQQPIEATTLLLAAEAALGATGQPRYRAAMERAYAWFLGGNDLGVRLADPVRGSSGDGLTPGGANANEGAESTLMWLTALEHIRAIRPQPAISAGAHVATEMAMAAAIA